MEVKAKFAPRFPGFAGKACEMRAHLFSSCTMEVSLWPRITICCSFSCLATCIEQGMERVSKATELSATGEQKKDVSVNGAEFGFSLYSFGLLGFAFALFRV